MLLSDKYLSSTVLEIQKLKSCFHEAWIQLRGDKQKNIKKNKTDAVCRVSATVKIKQEMGIRSTWEGQTALWNRWSGTPEGMCMDQDFCKDRIRYLTMLACSQCSDRQPTLELTPSGWPMMGWLLSRNLTTLFFTLSIATNHVLSGAGSVIQNEASSAESHYSTLLLLLSSARP